MSTEPDMGGAGIREITREGAWAMLDADRCRYLALAPRNSPAATTPARTTTRIKTSGSMAPAMRLEFMQCNGEVPYQTNSLLVA